MPEGDTVFITARRLDQALAGRVVTRCDLRVPNLALADLTGTRTEAVRSVGKHLLFRFSNGQSLHSHLRMDGAWRTGPTAARLPGGPEFAVRAIIGNAEWVAAGVRVHDLALVASDDEHSLVGHLGPDLVDPLVDLDEAVQRLTAQPDRGIAEALLDQRIAAGIGNVYKSELLFLHRLNPWQPVSDVAEPAALLADAARLLRANLTDFNRCTTGWRQPGQQYWVYGRHRKACRRCGAGIIKHDPVGDYGQRLTYYCPGCQDAGGNGASPQTMR